MTTEPGSGFEIELVYALPAQCLAFRVRVRTGASVGEAVQLAAAAGFAPAREADPARLAIFGRQVTFATVLRAGDRIELLRPLQADPKQRRRERAGEGRR